MLCAKGWPFCPGLSVLIDDDKMVTYHSIYPCCLLFMSLSMQIVFTIYAQFLQATDNVIYKLGLSS